MGFYEIVSAIVSIVSFFALIGNVLQYTKKREMAKDLYQMVQTQYNNYYLIARAVTRISELKIQGDFSETQLIDVYDNYVNYIRGVADSARIQMINFSKSQLGKNLFYQHPAFPEKINFSDEVKMGLPPELEDKGKKVEIAKMILKNKEYIIKPQKSIIKEKNQINRFSLLNESTGGVPGSDIGIVEYSNTRYCEAEKNDDQEFIYVLSGKGKARIGDCEIKILGETMFAVPPNTFYSILTDNSKEPVRVLSVHNKI